MVQITSKLAGTILKVLYKNATQHFWEILIVGVFPAQYSCSVGKNDFFCPFEVHKMTTKIWRVAFFKLIERIVYANF